MIEVTLDQRFCTIDMRLLPCKVLSHLLIGITVTMRLVIGFVHHVDSPAVAKFVEIFTIRIMRGAQEVDVGLFHQANVLFVGSIVNIPPRLWMVIMAIHTAQFDILAVDLEDFTHNFHFLDTQMVVEMFDYRSISFAQFHAKRIELRLFGQPESRFVQKTTEGDCRGIACCQFKWVANYFVFID